MTAPEDRSKALNEQYVVRSCPKSRHRCCVSARPLRANSSHEEAQEAVPRTAHARAIKWMLPSSLAGSLALIWSRNATRRSSESDMQYRRGCLTAKKGCPVINKVFEYRWHIDCTDCHRRQSGALKERLQRLRMANRKPPALVERNSAWIERYCRIPNLRIICISPA